MLKTASTILLIGVLFAALYGAVVLFSPQTVVGSRLQANTEWQNPVVVKGYIDEVRHLGAIALALAIASLFILFAGFKKGQKWAWWAFVPIGIFGWCYGLVRHIISGEMKSLIGHAIGVALLLIGLLLPLKAFFPKKSVTGPTS